MSKFLYSTDENNVVFFNSRFELKFERSFWSKTSNDVDFLNLRFELIKDLNSNINWESDFDWSKKFWLHCRSIILSKTKFKRVLRSSWWMRCFLNVSREKDRACIDCEDIDKNIIAIDISMNCWVFDSLSDVKSSNVNFFVINLSFLTSLASTISMSRSRLKLSREVELKLILVWDCTHYRKETINLSWNKIKTKIMTIWTKRFYCLISMNILIKMRMTIFLFFIFTSFMLRLYISFTLLINFWFSWRLLNHDLSSILDVM